MIGTSDASRVWKLFEIFMEPVRYIVFEGIDGAGKTTQASLLRERLRALDCTAISLTEPTYGKYGRMVREHMTKGDDISVERQRELFTLDRRQHVEQKIKPLLQFVRQNDSFVIIQHRYYLSAPAYQADGEAEMLALLREQQSFAPKPDIVFLLDLPPELAMDRLKERVGGKSLFEKPATLKKVRDRYLFLVNEGSEHIEIIDAVAAKDEVSESVLSILNLESIGA